jgi:hypothetical protein
MRKIKKEMLGVASEFAVASELGRRNIYAQPTFGYQKRTDLLIFSDRGNLLKVEAKGKQGKQWPNCKGISDWNSVLILVDFSEKEDNERPDFYVLTLDDWLAFLRTVIEKFPNKGIEIDADNCPVWTKEVKDGKPYKGCGITVKDVEHHKEKWGKIKVLLE